MTNGKSDISAAKAESVIHCRDCVNFVPNDNLGDSYCSRIFQYMGDSNWGTIELVSPDDFCSKARRMHK